MSEKCFPNMNGDMYQLCNYAAHFKCDCYNQLNSKLCYYDNHRRLLYGTKHRGLTNHLRYRY